MPLNPESYRPKKLSQFMKRIEDNATSHNREAFFVTFDLAMCLPFLTPGSLTSMTRTHE